MKTLSGILITVLFPILAFSQFNINGKIIDSQTNENLVGASVQLKNTSTGTQTNDKGQFILASIKEGKYTLIIGYIGYFTVEKAITVNKNQDYEIMMNPAPIIQDEVIIQANKADENTPATYSNIGKAELEKVNLGQDLPMLLAQTPSLVSTSDAGAGVGYTNLWIRGTDMQRINVTINGIPLNDAESHSVYFVDLPDLASSTIPGS